MGDSAIFGIPGGMTLSHHINVPIAALSAASDEQAPIIGTVMRRADVLEAMTLMQSDARMVPAAAELVGA